jgi:cytochrome c oxidase subunit 1
MPLQIGAPDVAFPRLNMFAYWLYVFGGLIAGAGFLTPQGAASFGWFATPRCRPRPTPQGSALTCGSSVWHSVVSARSWRRQLHHHDHLHARPRHDDVPDVAVHLDGADHLGAGDHGVSGSGCCPACAGSDRQLGSQVFNSEHGGPMLWQHLFWFFGHPEVYIIALPFFGMISEIIPVFSRKPLFGYKGLVFATIAIAALSVTVWAHHMYPTGQVLLPFFAFTTMLIAVPTGVKFFNWIGTMWRGQLTFQTPMLWAIGFLVTFLFGV